MLLPTLFELLQNLWALLGPQKYLKKNSQRNQLLESLVQEKKWESTKRGRGSRSPNKLVSRFWEMER